MNFEEESHRVFGQNYFRNKISEGFLEITIPNTYFFYLFDFRGPM